jgi:2-polyprenyl-3-methyl-5-hydroxy-6-metoxy-1,4-benzoquinol methylase
MPSVTQDEQTVVGQFEDQIERWTAHAWTHSLLVPFLLDWVNAYPDWLDARQPLEVCEFGGGGGVLLGQLHEQLGERVTLYNAELVDSYRAHQPTEAIQFMRLSILDSGLPDDRFDVVMMRFVLHHLIGKTWAEARENQALALREMWRLVKPGGLVLIQEQVVQPALACRAVYGLSRLASALKLRMDSFEVSPNTVIAYMTREQFVALCEGIAPASGWLANVYQRREMSLRWKLTLLMNNTGDAFVAVQKPRTQTST